MEGIPEANAINHKLMPHKAVVLKLGCNKIQAKITPKIPTHCSLTRQG